MTDAIGIDHVQVAIPPGGEGDARDFYGGLIGLTEIAKPADMAARGGCWFAVGNLQLHLGVEQDFRPAKKAHVALRSAGLNALRDRLNATGHATTDGAPVGGRARFFTADPFGNRIEFIEAPLIARPEMITSC